MRAAKAGDELVEITCRCGTVLVLEAMAGEWTCDRRHTGTRGRRYVIVDQVLTVDEYTPARIAERIEG